MSLELNIQITGAPASLPSLRYTIYEQPLDNATKLVELGDGVLSDVVNGVVNIPFTPGTLGAVVGVLLENADGTNVTSAKSAFGWATVTDSDAGIPVDPDPVDPSEGIPEVARGQSVTLDPNPGVVNLVGLGASITSYVFSGRSTLIKNMFAAQGLNINIFDESKGGRHVDEILAHWETVKANYTALGATCLCLGHVIGNDVSGFHPYSSMSAAERTALNQDLSDLSLAVTTNGNLFMPVEASFRGYDNDTLGDYYTWENESNGSLPFNTNMMKPLIQAALPAQYDSINETSFMQWYNLSYNYGVDYLETITNRIHPKDDGIEFYRRYMVDSIAAWIKGEPNIVFEKLSWQDAIISKRVPQAFWLTTTTNVPTGAGFTYEYTNSLDSTDTAVSQGAYMLPIEGYVPNSIFLGKGPIAMVYGTSTTIADDTSLSQFESKYLTRYMYCTNTAYEDFITLTGFNANQSVKFTIIGASGGGTYTKSTFRFNEDEATALGVENRLSNTSWGEITTPADANGTIVIAIKGYTSSGGATKGYFNAMKVEPL